MTQSVPLNRPALAILNEDYPKVRNSNVSEISELLNFILSILNIQKANDIFEIEKMDRQMLLVGDLIRTKFGNLTIPEIKESMKMYVSKEFPDLKVFRILDCISIGEVLKAYTNYRNETLRIYSHKKNNAMNQPNELTAEEKEAKIISGINFKFSEYIETKEVSSPFVWVFDELVHRKILKMPTSETPKLSEYYNSKLQQARTELLTEQKKVQPKDANERKNIKLEIEKILNYKSEKTEVRAKRIVLVEFFNKQIELNKTEIL